MNYINLLIPTLICIGGFIASTYQVIAQKHGYPVGLYFQSSGIMTIVGSLCVVGAIILTIILNFWWTAFLVLVASWILAPIIVKLFGSMSQILSALLILVGIIIWII